MYNLTVSVHTRYRTYDRWIHIREILGPCRDWDTNNAVDLDTLRRLHNKHIYQRHINYWRWVGWRVLLLLGWWLEKLGVRYELKMIKVRMMKKLLHNFYCEGKVNKSRSQTKTRQWSSVDGHTLMAKSLSKWIIFGQRTTPVYFLLSCSQKQAEFDNQLTTKSDSDDVYGPSRETAHSL